MAKKAKLVLLGGDKVTEAESLAKLFETLTGRKPTPKEIADAQDELKGDKAADNQAQRDTQCGDGR